ncbi:MAG: hypothetical protein IPQ07_30970 [Myxococcales bacterium]|nr:hypothetical protein [Myxococcales bacterium]
MGAVLVHIDLDGDRPHPASLTALAAGRAVASSWGATLYAALVIHDPGDRSAPDSTAQLVSTANVPALEGAQAMLARAGADKIVVAMTDVVIAPLWSSLGTAWLSVLDHLRPRLVLFGADSPSAPELGPRTGARLGARLLMRARAVGVEDVELRDRDGGYVRSSDSGAAVVLVGGAQPIVAAEEDVDLVVLVVPGGGDDRIELVGTIAAEVAHTTGAMVMIGDDVVGDPAIARDAQRLATLLGAPLVGTPNAVRAGVVQPGAVVEKGTPLAPEVMVAIGNAVVDLAGTSSLIRITPNPGKQVDGALTGPVGGALSELAQALEVAVGVALGGGS